MGFDLTHVYGLTEVYGPATVCAKHDAWERWTSASAPALNARQGVRYHLQRDARVLDPETMQPVPMDGETMGEIMFRGNIAMKGYLKNPGPRQEAFAGGWFHRRPGGAIPRRLHQDQGPQQGHHHLGRREHLVHRGRRTCCTATPPCWPPPWSPSPMRSGRDPGAFWSSSPAPR